MSGAFDWDDYMDGRVVVSLTEALWLFSEQCPEQGSDVIRISEWHDYFDEMASVCDSIQGFCRWDDGSPLIAAIEAHHRTALDADELPREWWMELTRRCGALARAARTRWPKPPPDDDDEESDE